MLAGTTTLLGDVGAEIPFRIGTDHRQTTAAGHEIAVVDVLQVVIYVLTRALVCSLMGVHTWERWHALGHYGKMQWNRSLEELGAFQAL